MAEPDDIARQLELLASKYAASAYRDGLRAHFGEFAQAVRLKPPTRFGEFAHPVRVA
jgi:hypothetical protein